MRATVIGAVLVSLIEGTAFAAGVKVMSRNVYLGADLGPGTQATSLQELVDAAGQILNQVDANRFDIRAEGLAREILKKKPDLVGLQEVALWRQAPCTDNPLAFTATEVRPAGDFLALLLERLNGNRERYSVVISQPEFDFQVWANMDGDESTSAPGCPFGSEIQGRLTMRDAILVRNSPRITAVDPASAHFDTLLQVTPGGVPINVTRGWTKVTAQVRGWEEPLTFVNTHLEAFDNNVTNHTSQDTDVGNGQVREAQAKELIAPGGPATGSQPVILVGDLNSDTVTSLRPGDELAHQALLNAGFVGVSTYAPLSCCLDADLLTEDGGGDVTQFDHKVDHVMTNAPEAVTLRRSKVTGLNPANGFWDSDHAGIFSALRLRR